MRRDISVYVAYLLILKNVLYGSMVPAVACHESPGANA